MLSIRFHQSRNWTEKRKENSRYFFKNYPTKLCKTGDYPILGGKNIIFNQQFYLVKHLEGGFQPFLA
jgi:hypothetical protein